MFWEALFLSTERKQDKGQGQWKTPPEQGRPYAIHILAADQKVLAEQLAGPRQQRWPGVEFTTGANGAPLLAGAAATFECSTEASTKRATT